MKYQIYSIVLLSIFIFNIFRFEIPYIEYAVFKPYIAKNLCVNKDKPKNCCEGKCFREKQIKQMNSTRETETTNEKNSNNIANYNEVKEFLLSRVLIPKATEIIFNFSYQIISVIECRYNSSIFVPPKF